MLQLKDKKVWLPIAVFGGFVLASLVLIATASEAPQVTPPQLTQAVRVIYAAPGPAQLVVRSQGTVAPRTESALIPEVAGPVVWKHESLVSGGFFTSGEPLLRIDDSDYKTALAKARAALARAEGEWEHARAQLKRLQSLAGRDIASPSQLDDARRMARVAEAVLGESRAGLEQAQRNLTRTELRAPYTGRVREENVDIGQFLDRGKPIATIYATDYVEIRLPIPDRELAFLNLPLSALAPGSNTEETEVMLSAQFAGGSYRWRGRVVRTEGEIDRKSRMVHVVARVEDPYGAREQGEQGEWGTQGEQGERGAREQGEQGQQSEPGRPSLGAPSRPPLAVGLFVNAEIAGPTVEDVTIIPRAAWRDDGSVLVVDEANRLQRRPVELVRIDREQVLVKGDIQQGERICVSPVRTFTPGMPVSVRAEQTQGQGPNPGREAGRPQDQDQEQNQTRTQARNQEAAL